MQDAKWANSDILLVSDGELRQPGQEVMRKLSGAKDKLSLRVHGLIVGSQSLSKCQSPSPTQTLAGIMQGLLR